MGLWRFTPPHTLRFWERSMPTPFNRIYRVCSWCSKKFGVVRSKLEKGCGVFCSRNCRLENNKAKLVHRVCVYCMKAFSIRPSEFKKGGGLFCSRACLFQNQAMRRLYPEFKFWKYVDKTEDCWLWTGLQNRGYGRVGTREGLAHRFSWRIHNGPVPVGLCVLHKCDVPLCVRPDNLFIGTAGDNNKDRVRKGRGNVRFIQAFGETKPLCEWLRDPRCTMKRGVLCYRIARGFSPEEAMALPLNAPEIQVKASRGREDARFVQAFGETKLLCEWARDPRCSIKSHTLRWRLEKGMSSETAIASPLKETGLCGRGA